MRQLLSRALTGAVLAATLTLLAAPACRAQGFGEAPTGLLNVNMDKAPVTPSWWSRGTEEAGREMDAQYVASEAAIQQRLTHLPDDWTFYPRVAGSFFWDGVYHQLGGCIAAACAGFVRGVRSA